MVIKKCEEILHTKHYYKKILVIGCQGSGKTYFSEYLSNKISVPCIHLDDHFWDKGWVSVSEHDFNIFLQELYRKKEYIIDGLYMASVQERIANAELVVFLDVPRFICILSVIKRTFDNLLTGRSLPQKIRNDTSVKFKKPVKSWAILFHMINDFFNQHRDNLLEILGSNKTIHVLWLKGRKEIGHFLGRL